MTRHPYTNDARHALKTVNDSLEAHARPAQQRLEYGSAYACVSIFVGPQVRLMLTNEAAQRLAREIGDSVIANLRPTEWSEPR
jgi:hypothetical protein